MGPPVQDNTEKRATEQVPVITQEMIDAGVAAYETALGSYSASFLVVEVYKAMKRLDDFPGLSSIEEDDCK
jgi:hypothetical protein